MSDERIGKPVYYDKHKVKGVANLYIYGPKTGWEWKKDGPNDGEFLVSFPKGFKGERDAIVVGSEGGMSPVHLEVK